MPRRSDVSRTQVACLLVGAVALGACGLRPYIIVAREGGTDGSADVVVDATLDSTDAPSVGDSIEVSEVGDRADDTAQDAVDATPTDVPMVIDVVDVPLVVDAADVPVALDVVDAPAALDVFDVPAAFDATDVPAVLDAGDSWVVDVPSGCDGMTVTQPRLIYPLSGSVVSSSTPTFRLEMATGSSGAVLEFSRNALSFASPRAFYAAWTGTGQLTAALPAPLPLERGTWYWRARATSGSATPCTTAMPSNVWQIIVPGGATPSNHDLAMGSSLQDWNNPPDGQADAIVSSPMSAEVWRWTDRPPNDMVTPLAGGMPGGSNGGVSLALADLDGDSRAESIAGAPLWMEGAAYGTGGVFIYDPLGTNTDVDSVIIHAPLASVGFGTSIAACDVNRDGIPEVIVGAPGTSSGAGAVYVFTFTHAMTGATIVPVQLGMTVPGAAGTGFGRTVGCAGDLNGDGYPDAIGAGTAELRVILGGPSARIGDPAYVHRTAGFDPPITALAGAGDMNGDGYADVVVGESAYGSGGQAWVCNGSASNPPLPGALPAPACVSLVGLVAPPPAGGRFGASVASLGDADGLPGDEIAVGAPGNDSVFVFNRTTVLASLAGAFGSQFGASVAGPGDVNGDGHSDLVVGAPGARQFNVLLGDGAHPVPTFSSHIQVSLSTVSDFGTAVAAREPAGSPPTRGRPASPRRARRL